MFYFFYYSCQSRINSLIYLVAVTCSIIIILFEPTTRSLFLFFQFCTLKRKQLEKSFDTSLIGYKCSLEVIVKGGEGRLSIVLSHLSPPLNNLFPLPGFLTIYIQHIFLKGSKIENYKKNITINNYNCGKFYLFCFKIIIFLNNL